MGRTRHFESGLTPRQREVLRLIAKGHTNGEIAEKLGVSLAGAKWHVSELLSRFGVNSREDLAELMERERRGPVERTRGWMAGLAGLMTVKLGAGTAVAAGIGVTAVVVGAGAYAFVLSGDTQQAHDVPPEVAELLPADPGDSVFQPEEAYAIAAREAARHYASLNSSVRPGLDFELAEAKWLPSSTSFWFRGYDWRWQSSNQEVFDLWAFRWELVDGSALGEDAHVTVLVSDGDSVPLGSLALLRDHRIGSEVAFHSGVASPVTPVPLAPPRQLAVSMFTYAEGRVQALVGFTSPWCVGASRVSPTGLEVVPAECPLVLPEHEPIRLYLETQGTVDGATTRTLHVAYRYPIAKVVAVLDTGDTLDLQFAGKPVRGRTLTTVEPLPRGALPTELIGYDADGNEVGRREYPPRPVRP